MPALDSPSSRLPALAPWRLVVVLGALTAFPPMAIDMYLPALPSIVGDLHASPEAGQQTVSAFFAGLALGQFFYGSASDRWGRRGPLFGGVLLYVLASALCALASSMPMLMVGRVLQALGACAGIVISRAVVRDRFDHRHSAQVLSQLMLVMGLAPILAPLIGGAILQIASWRAIFWLLVVFGLAVGTAVAWTLPESRSEATAQRARSEHPVAAYIDLLRQRRLIGYLLGGCLNSACLFTYIAASPGLLMQTYGISVVHFGWFFGANAAGLIGASQLNRRLLRRHTPDQVLSIFGLLAVVAATALAFAAFTGFGGMWGVLVPLFFALASYGVMTGNTTAGALSVDPQRSGSTAALMGAASFAAGAAVSAITALFHDATARPMAAAFLLCMTASVLAIRLLALPKAPQASA
jgi:MFS transporter, DHA1 family, multidrug resistance protein